MQTIRYDRALWLFWWVVACLLLAAFGGWLDRIWHLAFEFEDFFSPPHIIVYLFATLAGLIVMGMVFADRIRPAFGQGFHVLILPFQVPGALMLLGGGLVALGFAGLVLDNLWHSNFGLDETSWSFPHSMLAWSLLVTVMGGLSARLALSSYRPVRWYALLPLTAFVVLVSSGAFLGPLQDNRTYETLQLAKSVPVLVNQAEFMRTLSIYEHWNITRTNPLLMILAPLWFGAALGFVRRIDSRWWFATILFLIFWLLDNNTDFAQNLLPYFPNLMDSEANYAPLPVLLPLLIFFLVRRWSSEQRALLAAGAVFGLQLISIWGEGAWLILLIPAAGLMLAGWHIGQFGADVVKDPSHRGRVMLILAIVAVVPFITGLVDLWLRANLPG